MLLGDQGIEDVVDLLGNLAQVACQQCALHGVVVGALGDGHGVDLLIELGGGHAEVGLADDQHALRHVGQLSQLFAPTLAHAGAADDTEGDVASDLTAHLGQSADGQGCAEMLVQGAEHSGCVGAAAGEAGLAGDALGNADLNAAQIAACNLLEELRGLPGQVPLVAGDTLLVALEHPGLAGAHINFHIIPQGDGLHDGLDVVEAVVPLAQHIQGQVDLGKCRFK